MAQASITLSELGSKIRQAITLAMPDTYWVVAEIAEIRENRNGHCYLELIEKDNNSQQITARLRATIWSYTYRMLKPYFETTTRQQLMAGIKILVQVSVEFQEVYGLSLNIKDIDPTFTLGDMEVRRRQIIAQLEDEGVLEMNKELPLPEVIQRIAIVSSPTAAGYEDFVKQLENNTDEVKYYHKLFPAVMQGEKTEQSVVEALELIFNYEHLFDIVIIIRGGGAAADLISFDSYMLALNVAQFPLPVFTGIGHERDFTVTDLVAHTHMKTPTAVAEFIIEHNSEFIERIDGAIEMLSDLFSERMEQWHRRVEKVASRFVPVVQQHLVKQNHRIDRHLEKMIQQSRHSLINKQQKLTRATETIKHLSGRLTRSENDHLKYLTKRLQTASGQLIKQSHAKLAFLDESCRLHNPAQLLQRGYSITTSGGQIIKSVSQIQVDMEVTTHLKDGEFTSRIERI